MMCIYGAQGERRGTLDSDDMKRRLRRKPLRSWRYWDQPMEEATALSASMAESTTPVILSLSPCFPSPRPAASPACPTDLQIVLVGLAFSDAMFENAAAEQSKTAKLSICIKVKQ